MTGLHRTEVHEGKMRKGCVAVDGVGKRLSSSGGVKTWVNGYPVTLRF